MGLREVYQKGVSSLGCCPTVYGAYYQNGGLAIYRCSKIDGDSCFVTARVHGLLGDPLGSTSVSVNADGSGLQTQGYYSWGETRFGSVATEYPYPR